MKTAILEEGNRIQLPAEWVEEMELNGIALLERVNGGIFIKSRAREEKPEHRAPTEEEIQAQWDKVFRNKLRVPPRDLEAEAAEDLNNIELRGDDYVF